MVDLQQNPEHSGGTAWSFGHLYDWGLDFLLPPRCFSCGAGTDRQGSLCAACWGQLHFVTAPHCIRCGYPFEFDAGEGALCAACLARPPAYHSARSVFRYDDGSKRLILGFKHGDRTDGTAAFALWLSRAGAGVLPGADFILPVPLHRWRLFKRRFNQSALIGKSLSRITGIPIDAFSLVRQRATESQGGLNRRQRHRNVRGAFAVRNQAARPFQGLKLILVDDVYTTGATAGACAKALLQAGAEEIHVLTLARVVEPAHSLI